jgi:hypothetical protein
MASNATEQVPSAAAPAVTPGTHQGPEDGGSGVAGAVSEMSGKLDALIGVLTQQFARAPANTEARESGRSEAGLDNDVGFANISPQAARAIAESHLHHMRMERLLRGAGLASEEAQAPGYLPMLEAARESALRQAGRKVSVKETEGEDDDDVERGFGAQAELPAGIPMWPPRVFLARERTYTKMAQVAPQAGGFQPFRDRPTHCRG